MTTESSQMQQASEIFRDSGAGPPAHHHVQSSRSMDPHTSLDDYNRTMLQYTQRQMSTFVDLDGGRGHSSNRSSQSSSNSGHSNASSNGVLASQANGPPPTSAGAAAEARRAVQQPLHKSAHPSSGANY